ncbi:RP42 protein [Aphelenchoides avenae]|nr:RP42 protein [Aphelenchus avenae]
MVQLRSGKQSQATASTAASTAAAPKKRVTKASTAATLEEQIKDFFDNYANEPEDNTNGKRIGPNGMLALLTDVHVQPTDRMALVLAWKLKAETQCEFSWDEFEKGMTTMKTGNATALKKALPSLNAELKARDAFADFYRFTFGYAKSAAARSLDAETAVAYWQIVFQGSQETRINDWIAFVGKSGTRAVTHDTWNQVLEFFQTVDPSLSNYDPDAAWPSLIDEFVVYLKKLQK